MEVCVRVSANPVVQCCVNRLSWIHDGYLWYTARPARFAATIPKDTWRSLFQRQHAGDPMLTRTCCLCLAYMLADSKNPRRDYFLCSTNCRWILSSVRLNAFRIRQIITASVRGTKSKQLLISCLCQIHEEKMKGMVCC